MMSLARQDAGGPELEQERIQDNHGGRQADQEGMQGELEAQVGRMAVLKTGEGVNSALGVVGEGVGSEGLRWVCGVECPLAVGKKVGADHWV